MIVKFCFLLFFWIGSFQILTGQSAKVIVIGVDGLSVDGLQKATTPNMDLMMKKGLFTLNAQAVMPSKSSPNWMSMLSGVVPEKHQFKKNGFPKDAYQANPTCEGNADFFPTIFTLLKTQRPESKTAVIHQWPAFKRLLNLNEIDYRKNPILKAEKVQKIGLKYFKKEKPSLLFLHFNLVDAAGHLKGYKSKKYAQKVVQMDAFLKNFIELADQDANLYLLLVSDHGGIDKNHGGDTPEELTVPVILYGKNVTAKELTKSVSNIDIGPTIADILELKKHDCWDGVSILK